MMDEGLTEVVVEEARDKMAKAVDHVRADFATVRTGRATPALVEQLVIDYYGTPTPLRQLAGFTVPDAMLLVVSPYDKGSPRSDRERRSRPRNWASTRPTTGW